MCSPRSQCATLALTRERAPHAVLRTEVAIQAFTKSSGIGVTVDVVRQLYDAAATEMVHAIGQKRLGRGGWQHGIHVGRLGHRLLTSSPGCPHRALRAAGLSSATRVARVWRVARGPFSDIYHALDHEWAKLARHYASKARMFAPPSRWRSTPLPLDLQVKVGPPAARRLMVLPLESLMALPSLRA